MTQKIDLKQLAAEGATAVALDPGKTYVVVLRIDETTDHVEARRHAEGLARSLEQLGVRSLVVPIARPYELTFLELERDKSTEALAVVERAP